MADLPLHPLIVHVAIGLAVAVGLLGPVLLLTWVRGWLPRRGWWLLAVLQGALLITSVVAVRSGEVAALDARDLLELERIEHHEAIGQRFAITAAVTLVLVLTGGLLSNERRARQVATTAVCGTLLQLALGVTAGHAGGELVWGPSGMFERAQQGTPSLRLGGESH